MKRSTLAFYLTVLAASLCATAAPASAIFRITEVYTGITGEDGTPDWIEVTNFGDMDGDTGVLFYDDESLEVIPEAQLPSILLSPGESAVFLVTDDASFASIREFLTIWGTGVTNVGFVPDGGGLSQNGDTAAILLADGTVVSSVSFPPLPSSNTATIQPVPQLGLSILGERGAFESNPFFNDNIGTGDEGMEMITLVGSPGLYVPVPEPASALLAVLAGVGGVAGARRRK
ncbi:MAG: hypothetical protein AAF790_01840 [Planctomycetota bacterium]